MLQTKVDFPNALNADIFEKKCNRLLRAALEKEGVLSVLKYVRSQCSWKNSSVWDATYAHRTQQMDINLANAIKKIKKLQNVFRADRDSLDILVNLNENIDRFRDVLSVAVTQNNRNKEDLLVDIDAVLAACRTASDAVRGFQAAWGKAVHSGDLDDLVEFLALGSSCQKAVEILLEQLAAADAQFQKHGIKIVNGPPSERERQNLSRYHSGNINIIAEQIERKKEELHTDKTSEKNAECTAIKTFLTGDGACKRTIDDLVKFIDVLSVNLRIKRGWLS